MSSERSDRRSKRTEIRQVSLEQLKDSIARMFASLVSFGEDRLDYMSGLATYDPYLFAFVEEMAKRASEWTGQIRQGAHFMYMAIDAPELPRVSQRTIKSYEVNIHRGIQIARSAGMDFDSDSFGEVDPIEIYKKITEVEISWPYPMLEFEENRLLFGFVLKQHPAFTVGAMMIYQLKKAQGESRRLTRQLQKV